MSIKRVRRGRWCVCCAVAAAAVPPCGSGGSDVDGGVRGREKAWVCSGRRRRKEERRRRGVVDGAVVDLLRSLVLRGGGGRLLGFSMFALVCERGLCVCMHRW